MWFCRASTAGVTLIAFLWANVLIGAVDGAWLNFMNSVVGLFMLPVALLRWVWWRMNIWGEILAFAFGVPLAWLVWFPLGFKDHPYWMAFGVLFITGFITIIAATLLTRPEPMEILENFYRKARPPGLWGPVRARLPQQEETWGPDLLAVGAGIIFCMALVASIGAGFARSWPLFGGSLFALLTSGLVYTLASLKAGKGRGAVETSTHEGA